MPRGTFTCKTCRNIGSCPRCPVCNGPLKPRHYNLFDHGHFVAIDGEGVTQKKGQAQSYTLLNCSALGKHDYISSYRKGGLTTQECLDFLLKMKAKYPMGIFVLFGGSYDMNMMLGCITPDEMLDIWETRDESTHYCSILDGSYEVNVLFRKYMKTRRVCNDKGKRFVKTGRTKKDGKPEYRRNIIGKGLTAWDVTGFFQMSFIDALKGYKIASPDLINEMKARRGTFTSEDEDIMLQYCQEECELLVKLMDKLRDALRDAGIRVNRWDGAGAAAAALLKRQHVKQHMQVTPDALMHAVRCAYSGGRIELPRFGVIDQPIYQYDIQSAYPAAMTTLPSLAGGTWKRAALPTQRSPFSISLVEWDLDEDNPIHPFSYRTSQGSIRYPSKGANWVWQPELTVALKHNPTGITILDTYNFYPATDDKPFSFVPELFNERKRLKAAGNMAEKAIKLAINSIYGKTAQQKGGRVDKETGEITRPPFFQLEWAGYTTSLTRSRLYDAAMQDPDNIVAIATDGIFSLTPLYLDVGEGLGRWEETAHKRGTFAQSGVYFLTAQDGTETEHYRGFDKGALDRGTIERALTAGKTHVMAKVTRFVTMGAALHTDVSRWRKWETAPKKLSLVPTGTKRMQTDTTLPTNGIGRTVCALCPEADDGEQSKPFRILWLDGIENMPDAWHKREQGEEDNL